MFKRLRRWHWAVLLVATAIIAVAVQSAYAQLKNGFGGPILHVVTASDTTTTAAAPTAFAPVPGAKVLVNADSGDLFDIRFSAESTCMGAVGNKCMVKILVDGIAANPDPLTALPTAQPADVFDSAAVNATALPGARAIERWVTVPAITGAAHTIEVQYQADTGTTFTLRDWNLTVDHAD